MASSGRGGGRYCPTKRGQPPNPIPSTVSAAGGTCDGPQLFPCKEEPKPRRMGVEWKPPLRNDDLSLRSSSMQKRNKDADVKLAVEDVVGRPVPEGFVPLEDPHEVPVRRDPNRKFAHPNVNFYLAPGDELLTCCYDGNHQILSTRFTEHLMKCQRNHEKVCEQNPKIEKFEVCPFNFHHHIKKSKFAEHVKICPDMTAQSVALLSLMTRDTDTPVPVAKAGGHVSGSKASGKAGGNGTIGVKSREGSLESGISKSKLAAVGTAPKQTYQFGASACLDFATGHRNTAACAEEEEEDWDFDPYNIPADQPYYDPKLAVRKLDPTKDIIPMIKGLAPADRKKYHEQFKGPDNFKPPPSRRHQHY